MNSGLRLVRFLKPYWHWATLAPLTMLLEVTMDLMQPRMIQRIVDEATSNVDTRTEKHLQEALLRLMEGRTSFVIAHRLSTIRDADQVLVVNDGEIIERGTHEGLLEKKGFYHHLYVSQFKGQVLQGV